MIIKIQNNYFLNCMKTIQLKSLRFQPKSKIKAWEWKLSGLYKFFTSSSIQKKYVDEYNFIWPALIFWTWWSASVHFCDDKFSTSTDCFILKSENEEIDLKYIYYYLSWNINILEQGFKWAWLKHISKEYLWELQIPLPPLLTQKQIIQKLDKLTELISLRKESIKKQEDLTKSIFIEMFWDPMINEKGWEVKKLWFLTNLKQWLQISKPERYITPWEWKFKLLKIWAFQSEENIEYILNPLPTQICDSSDLIMSRTWEYAWKVLTWEIWVYHNNTFLIKVNNFQELNNLYLFHFLSFEHIFNILNKKAKKSGQPDLNHWIFKDLEIPLPPISLQNKFAEIVQKNEENIKKQKESLEKLKELYNWVMQESFRF